MSEKTDNLEVTGKDKQPVSVKEKSRIIEAMFSNGRETIDSGHVKGNFSKTGAGGGHDKGFIDVSWD